MRSNEKLRHFYNKVNVRVILSRGYQIALNGVIGSRNWWIKDFGVWTNAGHAALTLRSRLRCIILRKDEATGKATKAPTSLLVLNEVVIDRGPSPYLSNIDLYLDGKHITSVQGDGNCLQL